MNEPKATCTNSDEFMNSNEIYGSIFLSACMYVCLCVCMCVCVLANETDNTTLTENKNINYRLKRYFQRQIAILN